MIKLPKEPSDPKLLLAMEQIKAILSNHDIGAVVILQSETHGEWLNHISPSWSAAKLFANDQGEGIHVKALAKDYPSAEAHKRALELTTGMLFGFRDGAERIARNMEAVLAELSKVLHIDHASRFNR